MLIYEKCLWNEAYSVIRSAVKLQEMPVTRRLLLLLQRISVHGKIVDTLKNARTMTISWWPIFCRNTDGIDLTGVGILMELTWRGSEYWWNWPDGGRNTDGIDLKGVGILMESTWRGSEYWWNWPDDGRNPDGIDLTMVGILMELTWRGSEYWWNWPDDGRNPDGIDLTMHCIVRSVLVRSVVSTALCTHCTVHSAVPHSQCGGESLHSTECSAAFTVRGWITAQYRVQCRIHSAGVNHCTVQSAVPHSQCVVRAWIPAQYGEWVHRRLRLIHTDQLSRRPACSLLSSKTQWAMNNN